jgi:hypothetical protein
MREPRSDVPALVVRETGSGARLVWSLADLDRCFAREGSFEHGLVLANAVRWALRDRDAARIEGGTGLVALTGYAQGDRRILHLTSRLVTSPVPGRQEVLVPLGPIVVRMPWTGAATPGASLRVADAPARVSREGDTLAITIDQLLDHEVLVIE